MTTSGGGLATGTVAEILTGGLAVLEHHLRPGPAEAHPERVDFVSIDVEGLKGDILEAFPFGSFTPDLFCIEVLDTTLDGVTGRPVTNCLAGHGYRVVGWFPSSVFYARRPLGLGRG